MTDTKPGLVLRAASVADITQSVSYEVYHAVILLASGKCGFVVFPCPAFQPEAVQLVAGHTAMMFLNVEVLLSKLVNLLPHLSRAHPPQKIRQRKPNSIL